MLSSLRWVLPTLAALGLALGVAAVSVKAADEAGATLSITGKVVDKDGNAVADAKVNFVKPPAERGGPRPEPIATATTDKDGKFELKVDKAKAADGSYAINTMVQGKGGARAQVAIKEGKADPVTVELKLQERRGGGGGGNRGGQGGANRGG